MACAKQGCQRQEEQTKSRACVGDVSWSHNGDARGILSPEISAESTVAPEIVNSPIVPALWFTTNRLPPDSAMPTGKFSPEISAGFTG
jgi:hypothetical protein